MGIFFPDIIEQIDLMSDTKQKKWQQLVIPSFEGIQKQLMTISNILHGETASEH